VPRNEIGKSSTTRIDLPISLRDTLRCAATVAERPTLWSRSFFEEDADPLLIARRPLPRYFAASIARRDY